MALSEIKNAEPSIFSERMWLDKCIEANSYIPMHEALESGVSIDFEIGKFYEIYNDAVNIIKVLKVEPDIVWAAWAYCTINVHGNKGSGYREPDELQYLKFADIKKAKELSINEIQQYLPDIHPDRIKTEFEVGNTYLFAFDEAEASDVYGRQFNTTKLKEVSAFETMEVVVKLGGATVIDVATAEVEKTEDIFAGTKAESFK